MKTKRSRAKARLSGVGVLVLSIATPIVPVCETGLAGQSNTIHVNRTGSGAPDGSSDNPYHLVEAGVCKAQPGDTVSVRGGIYNEPLTIGKRVTLTASGGSAMIGQVIGKPHTTLKVLTYNTHLFGDEALGLAPTFADHTRARRIAERIREEDADVVGLQEVWDEERAAVIINNAGYPHHFYSNEHDEIDDVLNSGLLLLSRHPIVNPDLIFYEEEEGCFPIFDFDCDGWASKGFVKATIVKDGFQVGVFLTHAEAGREDADVRREQLLQLNSEMSGYRSENPGAEVIVMGDFNINGESVRGRECFEEESVEYPRMLSILGLKDAFRNAPCFDEKFKFTVDGENDLVRIFEELENPEDKCNERLDYLLYSHGNVFDMLPIKAEVRKFQVFPPITEDDKSSVDLSDHYGLVVEFSIFR